MTITSSNFLHLLDLNASTPLSSFVNHLCHSVNTTPMPNSVLGYYPHQTLYCKAHLIPNQLPIIYAQRLARPVTTQLTKLPFPYKSYCAKRINQVNSIIIIKKPMKKKYIKLTRAQQMINSSVFTSYSKTRAITWLTQTRVLTK